MSDQVPFLKPKEWQRLEGLVEHIHEKCEAIIAVGRNSDNPVDHGAMLLAIALRDEIEASDGRSRASTS